MGTISVRDHGARGDGVTLDTAAIQAAIDACATAGGGTVELSPGNYLTGMLVLKDNVTFHVGQGACLLGSTSLADYPGRLHSPVMKAYLEHDFCLLHARDARNIALTGEGSIDGQGGSFRAGTEGFNFEDRPAAPDAHPFIRPTLLGFQACTGVTISNLTLGGAASWCCNLDGCKEVRIRGVRLYNRVNQNNDGFDINACQDVTISDCHIDCGDDAIALKNGGERIAITNCIISSRWAAIRIGPESVGDFRDIVVSNCVIKDTYGCAIKIQEVEGGLVENVSFDNLEMNHVTGPISLRLGGYLGWRNERRQSLPIGRLRNVRFSNIHAMVSDNAYPLPHEVPAFPGEWLSCLNMTGVPGYFVENVSFSGLRLAFPGGGTREDAERDVPEMRDRYPEYHMYGTLPAYGVFLRHAKGVSFQDVTLETSAPDLRPALVGEDVEDLELCNFRAAGSGAECLVRLRDAREVYVHGCRPLNEVPSFLSVEGAASQGIVMQANDLRRALRDCVLADGARAGAIVKAPL
jgi:hypothetical protein